jgi:arylsulfatase A
MKNHLLAFVSICLLPLSTFAADRPNVEFILADDMGYGDVAAFNPAVRPALKFS